SRDLAGLRLRHGDRSHRDAEIRHSRPAHLLRGRPPVAASLRLRGAGRADQLWRVVAMKFTLPWLKEHLATEASLAEIVDKLTMLGLEVEEVTPRGADLSPFRVARVTEVRRHPNAERLSVCRVDTGEHTVEVVCGAPNVHPGMKAIFAPVGATIPSSGDVLKRATIRGVESNGMLCSARELLLGDDHTGIIELPADAPVGRPASEVVR